MQKNWNFAVCDIPFLACEKIMVDRFMLRLTFLAWECCGAVLLQKNDKGKLYPTHFA